MVALTWHANKYKVHELVYREDVPLVFMYLVFTRMPGDSYHGRLRSFSDSGVTSFERS